MKLRIFFLTVTLLFSAPAFADCVDDVCSSIQKILQARSSSFSKLKGKPGGDLRGDPAWAGTQAIPGVTDHCYVNKHGEGRRYEYRCIASELGTEASASLEKARQIGETLKAVFQSADPKLLWFADPDAIALANIDGFQGTEGWYGGYSPKKLTMKIKVIGSSSTGSEVEVAIFAKPRHGPTSNNVRPALNSFRPCTHKTRWRCLVSGEQQTSQIRVASSAFDCGRRPLCGIGVP